MQQTLTTKDTRLSDALQIGIAHWKEGNADLAIEYFESVRPRFESADSLSRAKFHNNLGLAKKLKGDLEGTLNEYSEVKFYLEQTDDPLAVGTIEANIASVKFEQGKFSEAHAHLDKAESLLEPDETLLGQALETRARVYLAEKRYTEAFGAILKSAQILNFGVEHDPLIETLKTLRKIELAREAQACMDYPSKTAVAKRFGITPQAVRDKLKSFF